MAEKSDELMTREETQRAHLPVTPDVTDLPSVQQQAQLERLEDQLRQTREEMGRTVEALKEKMSLRHVKEEAIEKSRQWLARPGIKPKVSLIALGGLVTAGLLVKFLRRR